MGGLVAYRLNLHLFKRSISVLEQKSYRIADWLFNNTFIDALLKTSGAYDAYPLSGHVNQFESPFCIQFNDESHTFL